MIHKSEFVHVLQSDNDRMEDGETVVISVQDLNIRRFLLLGSEYFLNVISKSRIIVFMIILICLSVFIDDFRMCFLEKSADIVVDSILIVIFVILILEIIWCVFQVPSYIKLPKKISISNFDIVKSNNFYFLLDFFSSLSILLEVSIN